MPHLIAQEGLLKGVVFDLEEGEEWIVGRDPDEADFVIEDSAASRKHVRITKTDDGIFLKNLSRTNPTLVNDKPVKANEPLKENDRVKIGNTFFLFSEEAPSDEASPPSEEKGKKAQTGYDDIFGDLEEPELPPEPEPLEAATAPDESDAAAEQKEEPSLDDSDAQETSKTAYDTIFEDLGAETEMPFNLLAETPLVLKVIGGPNAGAEIGLEKGRSYLLGKDSSTCDIVFQDLSVSRNHARLTISADGILELEDLGSKNSTVVNGEPIAEKQHVTSQDLIAMGTTIFLIIDREAAQETIYSPILPAYEAGRTATGKDAHDQEEEKASKKSGKKEIDWKKQKIPGRHLIFGGALAAIFLIVFLSFFSLFKSEGVEVAEKTSKSAIQDALENYPGVNYVYNPANGSLFLAGHVMTNVGFQELHYNLAQLSSITSIENNIIIDEGASKSINDVLTTHTDWQGVQVNATKPGHFIVHGYVKTSQENVQISEYLMSNFPYTDLLQNQIVVEDVLDAQIGGLLHSSGFGAVNAQLSSGTVFLMGLYSEKKESDFKKLVKGLNKLQGVKAVKNFATATSPGQASIDVSKQYAVSGSSMHDQRGYSAVINGHIYTLGESLNGMKITSIETSEILLEKDGLKYKIDYTR